MKLAIIILTYIISISSIATHAQSKNSAWASGYTHKQKTFSGDTLYLFENLNKAMLHFSLADGEEGDWYFCDTSGDGYNKKIETAEKPLVPTSEGGYALKTNSGAEIRMWIACPKIDTVKLSVDSIACDLMSVTGNAEAKPIRFYNTKTNSTEDIAQQLIYQWYIADTLQTESMYPKTDMLPPMGNHQLKLIVKNLADDSKSDTVSVPSFGVMAISNSKVREREVEHEIDKPEALSAPVEVEFENKSKGDFTVSEWSVYTAINGVQTNIARLFDTNSVYQLQKSGNYSVKLTVTNEITGCQSNDSTITLQVTDTAIEFPTAFTPNGDGVNDEFRPAYKSINSYKLTIYNRWGRRIFESTTPTEGWNGKIGNKNAPEGVYMYVCEAEGYDANSKITRKGSVTIVR